MKRLPKKNLKAVKGMPTAVLLSILIHAALFLLAGMFVVFTVVKSKEVEFAPPKAVERPKMKLKKPKVKVKKSSKPRPTPRIVTTVKRTSMPDFQLPEMSGMADGLGGGVAGFDLMPDLEKTSIVGSDYSIGNDFVGTFYDFKRDREGRPIPCAYDDYWNIAGKFVRSGWKASVLSRYYQSPKKLYATTFVVPPTLASIVPAAFGEDEAEDRYWMVHYKGQLVSQRGMTFRFVARGDGLMGVRLDGETVLAAGMLTHGINWVPRPESLKFWLGNGWAWTSDWITIKPDDPLDMETIVSDGGGSVCFILAIQEKGVEYERRRMGSGPVFPVFKTAELSHDLLDAIYESMPPGEITLTNGPVFRDYGVGTKPLAAYSPETTNGPASKNPSVPSFESGMRTWRGLDGKTMVAEYIATIGDKVVLKMPGGRQKKLPVAKLSEKDRAYIELANPPSFKIDFSTSSRQVFSVEEGTASGKTIAYDYRAKIRLRQKSSGQYNHELCAEFFAIGKQIHGNRHILLDRQKHCFTPSNENRRSCEFAGRTIRLPDFTVYDQHRGKKPYGYLVVVTDSRGKIIQHRESNAWLYENLENLKRLPVGAYMDKNCTRVFPEGPKRIVDGQHW